MKLSQSVRGALRRFAYWVAAGTVGGDELLRDIPREDCLSIFDAPSACEAAFAIFMNHLEFDASGKVANARQAEMRAAQYLRACLVEGYEVEPPLQDREVELHMP